MRSEHVIGLVKNKFHGLREIRMKLNAKKDVRPIVDFIAAGYVLHNILQTFKDDWDVPGEADGMMRVILIRWSPQVRNVRTRSHQKRHNCLGKR